MKKISIIVSCFFLFLLTSSCHKELEKVPLQAPSTSTFLRTESELKAALVGCYSPLTTLLAGDPYSLRFEVFSDIGADRDNTPESQMGNPTASAAVTIWTTMYQVIGRCNFILDNINRVEGANAAVVKQITGETKFLRAYSYALLAQLYGDVPLVTKTQTLSEASVPRDPKSTVIDFVLTELGEAANLMSSTNSPNTMALSSGAAWGLASRVALFNERWTDAISAAEKVMLLEGTQVELNPSYANITMRAGKTSKEILWAIQYNYTDVVHTFTQSLRSRMASGFSNRIPTQSLIDSYECTDGLTIDKSPLFNPTRPFENRDPRLGATVALPGSVFFGYQFETHKDSLTCWNYNLVPARRVANLDATHAFASFSGYCWRKYADPTELHATRSEINPIVLRYAEVLLNYAEAKVQANQIDASVYTAINKIRARVNMPLITSGQTSSNLLSIIRRERKVELAGEGLRYFDIIRWKIADKVLSGPVYGRPPRSYPSSAPVIDANGTPDYSNVANRSQMRVIQTRVFSVSANYLWPIPNIEIQTNKKLTQNPGY